MPGMPATGLGGIFYALLILWIVIRQAWRAAVGGGAARWRPIIRLGLMLAKDMRAAITAEAGKIR